MCTPAMDYFLKNSYTYDQAHVKVILIIHHGTKNQHIKVYSMILRDQGDRYLHNILSTGNHHFMILKLNYLMSFKI